jgi:hypothetical protein
MCHFPKTFWPFCLRRTGFRAWVTTYKLWEVSGKIHSSLVKQVDSFSYEKRFRQLQAEKKWDFFSQGDRMSLVKSTLANNSVIKNCPKKIITQSGPPASSLPWNLQQLKDCFVRLQIKGGVKRKIRNQDLRGPRSVSQRKKIGSLKTFALAAQWPKVRNIENFEIIK